MLNRITARRRPRLQSSDLLEGFGEGCLPWCQHLRDLELKELAHREPYKLPRVEYINNSFKLQINFTCEN